MASTNRAFQQLLYPVVITVIFYIEEDADD